MRQDVTCPGGCRLGGRVVRDGLLDCIVICRTFLQPLFQLKSFLDNPISSTPYTLLALHAVDLHLQSTMYVRSAITAALAATPLAVSAAGTLGFAVGNTNPDGTCKVQSDFEADFKAIASNSQSTLVRTYSSSDQYGNPCNTPSEVMPAAKAVGFKVLLGMWPDGGAYQKEKAPLVSADLAQYGDTLYGITVGSEGIYRGTYSENDLLGWLGDMQQTFPSVTIGTADSWNGWANGSMDGIITSGIKLILANGFAYWQYQELSNATKTYFYDMSQALGHIQDLTGSLDGIHFMNGETGWPGVSTHVFSPVLRRGCHECFTSFCPPMIENPLTVAGRWFRRRCSQSWHPKRCYVLEIRCLWYARLGC
jgi:glucan 1,3-beta-glucosidase